MSKHKRRRIIRSIVTVILSILMYLSFAAGILMITLNHTLDNGTDIVMRAVDSEYCEKMQRSVRNTLENKMSLMPINVDDILEFITEDVIVNDTKLAATDVVGELFGENTIKWSYENEALFEKIEILLKEYSDETGINYEEGSAEQVYGMICETVTAEIRTVSDIYTSKASPYVLKILRILSLWYIPCVLFVVFAAAELIILRHHIKNGVYNVILSAYFGAFTLLAASSIMYYKDYLGRTILGDVMLQELMQRLYLIVFYDLRQAGFVLTSLLLVMGIVMSVALALRGRRHRLKAEVTIE